MLFLQVCHYEKYAKQIYSKLFRYLDIKIFQANLALQLQF